MPTAINLIMVLAAGQCCVVVFRRGRGSPQSERLLAFTRATPGLAGQALLSLLVRKELRIQQPRLPGGLFLRPGWRSCGRWLPAWFLKRPCAWRCLLVGLGMAGAGQCRAAIGTADSRAFAAWNSGPQGRHRVAIAGACSCCPLDEDFEPDPAWRASAVLPGRVMSHR